MFHPSNLCYPQAPRTILSGSTYPTNDPSTDSSNKPQQELCRCATKKRGEPLDAYVRRISSLMLEVANEEGLGEGDMEMAAAAEHVPRLVPIDHDGRPMSPKELAAGLLEASKDVEM